MLIKPYQKILRFFKQKQIKMRREKNINKHIPVWHTVKPVVTLTFSQTRVMCDPR